jgi:hypothetical protein
MGAKDTVTRLLAEYRNWEVPDDTVTAIHVTIAGDPPAGIPDRHYQIAALNLDPESYSEEDWQAMLEQVREKVVGLFNILDGEGEPIVDFETAEDDLGETGEEEKEPPATPAAEIEAERVAGHEEAGHEPALPAPEEA